MLLVLGTEISKLPCAMSYTAISPLPLPLSNLYYLVFMDLSLIKIYGLILLFQLNTLISPPRVALLGFISC